MSMVNQSKLITILSDIHYHLLSILPNFSDLGAAILTHRCFHDTYKTQRKTVLHDVARNMLGCLFDEALLLARAQEAAYGLGDPCSDDLTTNTVFLVVNNDYILRSLEVVVFGLLKSDEKKFDIYDSESLARFAEEPFTIEASPTEAIRFRGAGYRFWRFVLEPQRKKKEGKTFRDNIEVSGDFLKTFPPSRLLELNHFVHGISNLIYAMSRRPQESDGDWDFVSTVLSTGPENILRLWDALQDGDSEFEDDLNEAGGGFTYEMKEGFFSYPYGEAAESKKLNDIPGLRALEPIFDGDNAKMREILEQFAKQMGTGERS
ncbi:hypothetical protein DFH08DRAFT_951110 [Mycena albidolilacea]|uniref:Uncharacterized protein n=1 Tax=Mycena albidolilacea TaxID=1033008 RepID=A0AAD7AMJ4_9AGAR|nr:hypothetical protein DFH08DRAFT_951110 [Mycena albidolilacea]